MHKQIEKEFLQNDSAFFAVNLENITDRYRRWKASLPDVEAYYAVKCNQDLRVLQKIHSLGLKFDCASKNEIEKILGFHCSPSDIIFSNPSKLASHISFARENQIARMTFDTEAELEKIKSYYPEAQLLLRIKTDDQHSQCRFSMKYGASVPEEAKRLLEKAKELSLDVIGVSFHVGSSCMNAVSFEKAIEDSATVFQMAHDIGFECTLLDIGGGFMDRNFEEIAFTIRDSLNKHFSKTKVIAEPGRFFVEGSHTLCLTVINKKIKNANPKEIQYTVNDSVYCSLNNIIMDHFEVNTNNLRIVKNETRTHFPSRIYGCSCDSADIIAPFILLQELEVGDHLIIEDVGAYTTMFTPHVQDEKTLDLFNGFGRARSIYI